MLQELIRSCRATRALSSGHLIRSTQCCIAAPRCGGVFASA